MTGRGQHSRTPAKGGNEYRGSRVSSRDIASHTTLKHRKEGQDTLEELQKMKNLQEELKESEGHINGNVISYEGHDQYDDDDEEEEEEDNGTEAQELLAAADALGGNRLVPKSVRRWDDDAVFRNQSRGETKAPKRFINDTVRNDFHSKFLKKLMN